MSDQQTLISTDTDPGAAVVAAEQARIIDAAVRASRQAGWCGEFEAVMRALFPDGPPGGGTEFVDSDGWSCRGRDRDGYNQDGRDQEGRDRDGYNGRGYDRDGYDRGGYDQAGWNREGIHRDGRDSNAPEYRARFQYDQYGYDRAGFNDRGVNRDGYTREQVLAREPDVYRYDADGYDVRGVDRYGYTRADNERQ
jgi:hypothetical protein